MRIWDDLTHMIRKVIIDSTKFHVPRLGQIRKVADSKNEGRILVAIPSLGWNTADEAIWCHPKQKNSLITPKMDDWVIVEFMDGKKETAVYSGKAYWMKEQVPTEHENQNDQILFESNNGCIYIKYTENERSFVIIDDEGNSVELSGGKIILQGGGETFLKGTTFDSWITGTLKAIFDAHVHPVTAVGSPTGPPTTLLTAPTNHLSDVIEGA